MKLQPTVLALAIAVGTVAAACNSGSGMLSGGAGTSGPGTTGTAGTTGSAGTSGGGDMCMDVTACGGNVVGTWTASSPCLKVSGALDVSAAGLDPSACVGPTISGTLAVTGTWTANLDGTYTDGTTTTGSVRVDLPPGCLNLSGAKITCDGINRPLTGIGLDSPANCVKVASGGCTCTGTVNHKGSIGLLSADPQNDGNYKTSGNTLTMALGIADAKYNYCVSGSQLTLTPQTVGPPSSGTIVLQNGGGLGTAGVTGTAGTTGSGAGAGGTTGTAGRGGSGGTTGVGGGASGTTGSGGQTSNVMGPCDIYATASTPCVAAYSTIRRLNSKYTGALYQVRNGSSAMNTGSGGMTKDIGATADGFADTATQDAFCMGMICTFSLLYDQSGNGNNLPVAKKGLSGGGTYAGMDDFESSATKGMLMVGGHKVYSLYMNAREGYRIMTKGKNVPTGSAAEGIYELADGTHSGSTCCWDFGNVTTDPTKYATMNTLFFGTAFWGNGAGNGPWFMADFEAGVWAGGSKVGDPGWGSLNDMHPSNPNDPSMKVPFAMGILKTSTAKYAIRAADTQKATDLTTAFEGAMPKAMDNQGAILLGVGGDNSNNSWGTFYEGAIVSGYPATTADLAVLQNIQAVNYGK